MDQHHQHLTTVFHITHWKAGSQWLHRILREIAQDRIVDPQLPLPANVQMSWVKSGEAFIRYEDLLMRDVGILEEVIIRDCGIGIGPDRLQEIVVSNRFESLTHGRTPGEEDPMARERKGIAGDWQNYFAPAVTDAFNARYGDLQVKAGYQLADSGVQ